MKKYVWIYRADPSLEPKEGEMEVWGNWFNQLKEDGTLLDFGNIFHKEARVVSVDGTTQDTPATSSPKEIVIGYSIVQADSMEQATKIIQDGPAAKYGCSVEIREIVQMPEAT